MMGNIYRTFYRKVSDVKDCQLAIVSHVELGCEKILSTRIFRGVVSLCDYKSDYAYYIR